MNDSFLSKRTALLQQMAALDSMELDSLKAEYGSSPSGSKSGPCLCGKLSAGEWDRPMKWSF